MIGENIIIVQNNLKIYWIQCNQICPKIPFRYREIVFHSVMTSMTMFIPNQNPSHFKINEIRRKLHEFDLE